MQQIDAKLTSDFLQRLYAVVNVHDAQAVAASCCQDVVWDDPGAAEILRGRDAVYRFHHDTLFPAFPDMRAKLLDRP
jgi:ketosteroid isomerase-like protein